MTQGTQSAFRPLSDGICSEIQVCCFNKLPNEWQARLRRQYRPLDTDDATESWWLVCATRCLSFFAGDEARKREEREQRLKANVEAEKALENAKKARRFTDAAGRFTEAAERDDIRQALLASTRSSGEWIAMFREKKDEAVETAVKAAKQQEATEQANALAAAKKQAATERANALAAAKQQAATEQRLAVLEATNLQDHAERAAVDAMIKQLLERVPASSPQAVYDIHEA